ncbi:unnamed protein product [Staurois parvus]|uniref:Uncharacterized protein n=1 Tax=Staurois parvus TaxID=386267 RepID=A0ABN9CUX4_9NEOB|nr:unnamed protein product [Staurois parvus]
MFSSLLEKMELFKQETMQDLVKREHQLSFTRQKNAFENINNNPAMDAPSIPEDESEKKSSTQFHEIVEALNTYLSPLLLQLEVSLPRQPSTPLSSSESVRAKSREKEEKPASSASVEVGDYIILLADRFLQQMPLEALAVFKDDSGNSVSRDFSLQLLYNRIHTEQTEEGELKREVKSAKESKQKKNIKTIPINRDLPANCMPVETHRFKYIVDLTMKY